VGNVFVTDSGNDRLVEFTSRGKFLSTIGGFGEPPFFQSPGTVAVAPSGDLVVFDDGLHQVLAVRLPGQPSGPRQDRSEAPVVTSPGTAPQRIDR